MTEENLRICMRLSVQCNILLLALLVALFLTRVGHECYRKMGKARKSKKRRGGKKRRPLADDARAVPLDPYAGNSSPEPVYRNYRKKTKQRNGAGWIPTNISYFGQNSNDDNGEGFAGVNLHRMGTRGMTFEGKRVYPVAVHQDEAPEWMYKVVEIKGPKIAKGFYGYVVDICDRNDGDCSNRNKNGFSFLVDIHKTGFVASGNRNNGKDLTTGLVRAVGSIHPKNIPTQYLLEGASTYIACKCTGRCNENDITWDLPKNC